MFTSEENRAFSIMAIDAPVVFVPAPLVAEEFLVK